MAAIHADVEAKRGSNIPQWAYRDVLFMLIDYSIRAFELLEHKLSLAEKREVFTVFTKVGTRMGVTRLPATFEAWEIMRKEHLQQNLQYSHFTEDLYRQYRKHLGFFRHKILLESQAMVVPQLVHKLLGLRKFSILKPLTDIYKLSRKVHADRLIKSILLPAAYKENIRELDMVQE